MEREIWLWDFAGQADYRLIHLLYMDETALALLVFDPQEDRPVRGPGPVGPRPDPGRAGQALPQAPGGRPLRRGHASGQPG